MRTWGLLVALVLTAALFGGGLAHSAVPHDHGGHGSSVETIWSTLHQGLSHEWKSVTASLPMALALVTVLFVVALPRPAFAPLVHLEEVRRGTAKYRKFR